MSETITGYQTSVQTLSALTPFASIVGTINAYGTVGVYPIHQGSGTIVQETIEAALFGAASTIFTINNSGIIESHGGNASNPFDLGVFLGGNGTLTNSGTIAGASGVAMLGTTAADYLNNRGLINGSIGIGAYFKGAVNLSNNGLIEGVQGGLQINGIATLSNLSLGTIISTQHQAVQLGAGGTLTNAGLILGGAVFGAVGEANNMGQITVAASGSQSNYAGLYFKLGGTATNSGSILAENGIVLDHYTATSGSGYVSFIGSVGNHGVINANGTANATSGASNGFLNSGVGIYLADPGSVVNAGIINATHAGIVVERGPGQVTNASTGAITASEGYGLYLQNGGYFLNQGTLSGARDGVIARGAPAIINDGLIEATGPKFTINGTVFNPFAIDLIQAGSITNATTAVISGARGIDFQGNLGPNNNSLSNAGTITATTGAGVYFLYAGNAQNNGTIIGNHAGIVFIQSGDLINNGSINATGTSFANTSGSHIAFGVALTGGGTITNAVGAHISGYGGIYLANGSGYLNNLGTITGIGPAGVGLGTSSSLSNQGLISAGPSGAGVAISGVDPITNQSVGTIYGGASGIFASNSSFLGVTLFNNGKIDGGQFGIDLQSGGTVANYGAGLITGATDGVLVGFPEASITNHANIVGGVGVLISTSSFSTGATVQNFGTITGMQGIAVDFVGTNSFNSSELIFDPGAVFNGAVDVANGAGTLDLASAASVGTLTSFGTSFNGFSSIIVDSGAIWNMAGAENLSASSTALVVSNNGTIDENSIDSLTISGAIMGQGEIQIDHSSLTLDGAVASGQLVFLAQTGDVLALGDARGFNGTVSAFTLGDTIELTNVPSSSITGENFASGVLTINEAVGSITLTFAHPSSFSGEAFSLTGLGASATDISLGAPCFAAGTQILTVYGPVNVEDLDIGDRVVLHGGGSAPIRWLGHRHVQIYRHPRPDAVRPVRIAAGAIADGVPYRDLVVSPDHAIYLENCLIPAKALLNQISIKTVNARSITYYHVELAFHAVIYADGLPVESYLDTGNRAAFTNGASVVSLHPHFEAPNLDDQKLREIGSCAPLAEFGPAVEAARRNILARVGGAASSDPSLHLHPCASGGIWVLSRSVIPGYSTPDPRDRRQLGVKISRIIANGEMVSIDHPLLTQGWHATEPDGRWTNGRALIPADLVQGRVIELEICSTLHYPVMRGSARRCTG